MSLAVVGADYPNTDKAKSNRRFEILLCEPGEPVDLVPEPKNPADPNAIAVFSCRGIQIGYLRAERAPIIGTYLSRGRITSAIFQAPSDGGAIIRIGMDGAPAELPHQFEQPESPEDGSGFWPDYIPPDD